MGTTVRWLGNSGLALERPGLTLWLDPYWADEAAAAAELHTAPPDVVAFTHGHQGHFRFAEQVLARSGVTVVGSSRLLDFIRNELRLPAEDAIAVEAEQPVAIAEWQLLPIAVPHPAVLPGLDVGGAPAEPNLGFVLEADGQRIFHVGDFELEESFRSRLRALAPVDAAALTFWGPRVAWSLEEGVERLLEAARLCAARVAIPCFHFTGDTGPVALLVARASAELPGCTIAVMRPGDRFPLTSRAA